MKVRSAKREELPRLATIVVQAFSSEPTYTYFYPFRENYPKDYHDSILLDLSKLFSTLGGLVTVIEVEPDDFAGKSLPGLLQNKVVGVLTLMCHGSLEQKRLWSRENGADGNILFIVDC